MKRADSISARIYGTTLRIMMLVLAGDFAMALHAEHLVLLTTNDTHSNIDTDRNGVGGILPRMAVIDSVRKAEKNVLLIDAGDAVQGTLYFKYFHGDVEYPLFNMMKYDIRILGNHEFDNGIDQLARYWKGVKADRLSANYDFSRTPAAGLFKPYVIKKIGRRKIGFIGINVNPASLISKANTGDMGFTPAIASANKWADYLKNREHCDLVVAVSHIGYKTDPDKEDDVRMAQQSRNIDLIIGGHSHTFVDPGHPDATPCWISNADGKPVLVTQTGKYGRNVGYINIDLDRLADRKFVYEYIPVTDRFSPSAYNKEIIDFLAPYRAKVDSVNQVEVGYSLAACRNGVATGALANWTADMGMWVGMQIADSLRSVGREIPAVDFALMNVGGIRQPMPEGVVSEGLILSMFPFSNRMMLISIKGSDLIKTFGIVAPKGGESVSDEIRVLTDADGKMTGVTVNGNAMDPDREYTVLTIDYIAEGNDDMTPMANHEKLWVDSQELGCRVLQYMAHTARMGIPVSPDTAPRFLRDYRTLKQ